MTAEELRIATAVLGAGSYENHDQLVKAVAKGVNVETKDVEYVLQRLRIRQVLHCIATSRNVNDLVWVSASVRYERGIDWNEEN